MQVTCVDFKKGTIRIISCDPPCKDDNSNLQPHKALSDYLIGYLCGDLQKTFWSMVQTSLVSFGNCVASPLSYSSGCWITPFLITQKSSLNGNLLQFSLETGHIPVENYSNRKEILSYFYLNLSIKLSSLFAFHGHTSLRNLVNTRFPRLLSLSLSRLLHLYFSHFS